MAKSGGIAMKIYKKIKNNDEENNCHSVNDSLEPILQ